MLIEGQASSIGELVDEVQRITRLFKPNPEAREEIWFRGQSSCDWGLIPNLYRTDVEKFHYVESTLIDRFMAFATPLVARIPTSEWEWYFLARHHGLPTRLLDWSESLFVATYFALGRHMPKDRLELDEQLGREISAADFNECPTVWILEAGSLNFNSIRKDAILVPGPRADPYLPYALEKQRFDSNAKPIAILPARSNSRIVAQHGMFTAHGHEHIAIDQIAESSEDVKLARVHLDKARVAQLAADLRTCGVHQLTVFPDLDSVAYHTCWVCQSAVE